MEENVLSVSGLTARMRDLLEGAFPDVWVSGEVVGSKLHSSGHVYLTLKDEGARLNGIIFRGQLRFLAVRPDELVDGLQVVCHGRMSLYEPSGGYRIVIDQVRPQGRGLLLQKLEELKGRLAAEGLFDEERKKPLPYLPSAIGVVTSETGAAIRDMLRIIEERFPSCVKLYPALVQGEAAARDIVRGIALLDKDSEVDVIIVGRGGGAFEDLLPFSDEAVVRAVAGCRKPVISAVGHEVDTPLCDFAADKRAPTPTAAAQMVVPDRTELQAWLSDAMATMDRQLDRMLEEREMRVADLLDRVFELSDRQLQRSAERLARVRAALALAHPAAALERWSERAEGLGRGLDVAMENLLARAERRAEHLSVQLEQLGPRAVLERGYAIVRRMPERTALTGCGSVTTGDEVEMLLSDGRLEGTVTAVERD
jgi:exodeoxyribonuclease VII large subunit